VKKIDSLLKPGQMFVHLADLNLYTTAFADSCIERDVILLPTCERDAIYQISKKTFGKQLLRNRMRLLEQDYKFLQNWGTLSPTIQSMVITEAYSKNIDFSSLVEVTKAVFGTDKLKKITAQEKFEQTLHEAATKMSWKVVQCGYIEEFAKYDLADQNVETHSTNGNISSKKSEFDLSSNDLKGNIYTLKRGILQCEVDKKHPADHVELLAEVHVFIAKRA
jgi:hypothetical protein